MMRSMVIRKYGAAAEVLKYEEVAIPAISRDEILVQQQATSVNPIDFRMRGGYGRVIFSKKRGFELPLTLGRDVSGKVAKIGENVKGVAVGDLVYGFPGAKAQGAYAEYVVTTANDVVHKPESLSAIEAAAIPYVACTVWDALVTKAGLGPDNAKGKKVFVQGGAGGIGSLAIQLLKAWGAYVATTCSGVQRQSVAALGADMLIDYETENYAARLSGFDVALETIGGSFEEKTLSILRKDGRGIFVTLIHPLLQNFDNAGILKGAFVNLFAFGTKWVHAKRMGLGGYFWATFSPSKEALITLRALIDGGKMHAHIDREFLLKDLIAAHEYCEQGKANGKVVIKIAS